MVYKVANHTTAGATAPPLYTYYRKWEKQWKEKVRNTAYARSVFI